MLVGILIFVIVLLLAVVIVFGRGLMLALLKVEKLETFLVDTMEDFDLTYKQFDKIVTGRMFLADDPDIQNIARLIMIVHDTLAQYLNEVNNVRKAKAKKK